MRERLTLGLISSRAVDEHEIGAPQTHWSTERMNHLFQYTLISQMHSNSIYTMVCVYRDVAQRVS